MSASEHHGSKGVLHPPRHLVPQYVEPIMYLAERMAAQDPRDDLPAGMRTVDELTRTVKLEDIRRRNPAGRVMDERRACSMLDQKWAKMGALVVLALVMKQDTQRGPAAKAFFSRVRELLGADPVAVPHDLEEHKRLVMDYLPH